MTGSAPDERERALEAAAREYGRLLAFGDRGSRVQVELKHAALMPELAAKLDAVEELLGAPTRPHTFASATAAMQRRQVIGNEWRTKTELFGWPLVHIANGVDPETGRTRVAKGIIAIGNVAIGAFAMGGMAMGGVTMGGFSFGLFALGGIAAGGLAFGGISIGIFAVGGVAVGFIAMGGLAVGHYVAGGGGVGTYRLTSAVQDPEAKVLFLSIRDGIRGLLGR